MTLSTRVAATLVAGLVGIGCTQREAPDAAPVPPTSVVLFDLTARAATPAGVRAVSEALVAEERLVSGTAIEAWVMGDRPEATELVGRFTYSDPKRRGKAAIEGARRRFRADTVTAITTEVERVRSARPPRLSPIAGSITKILLGRPATDALTLHVVTDLREVSDGLDFECRTLPSAAQFRRACERAGALLPASLNGVQVVVVGVQVEPVGQNRCPWPITRHHALVALWTAIFEDGGAASVQITGGLR